MKDDKNPLEVLFIDLGNRWKNAYEKLEKKQAPKRESDLQALAAMLLAFENPRLLSHDCLVLAYKCQTMGENRYFPWIDSLPWSIATEAINGWPNGCSSVETLTEHLSEPKSCLRGWALEMAWFVRSLIDKPYAIAKLLGNVEQHLAYVTQSWGLAAAISESKEVFELEAAKYEAHQFGEQYELRRKHFTEQGILSCQAHFWKLEANCRKIISESLVRNYHPQLELEI